MIKSDFHVHTNYCDGQKSPEEVVERALELNMEALGLCVHSYTFFDESYCVKKERQKDFIGEIKRLKKKYKGKLRIYCGVEQDYYSDAPANDFDYVIGSVHYHRKNGEFFALDHKKEIFVSAIERLYGGDYYTFAQEFFEVASNVAEKTNADIIGHFDIIRKFNGDGKLYDENSPVYVNAVKKAVDKLVACKKPFEINTGGISRGYLDAPYPALWVIDYIKSSGGSFVLSSDAHNPNNLLFAFDRYENLLK